MCDGQILLLPSYNTCVMDRFSCYQYTIPVWWIESLVIKEGNSNYISFHSFLKSDIINFPSCLREKKLTWFPPKNIIKIHRSLYTDGEEKSDILIKVSYIFLIPQLNLRILIKYIFWYLIRILKFNWGIRKICVKKKIRRWSVHCTMVNN